MLVPFSQMNRIAFRCACPVTLLIVACSSKQDVAPSEPAQCGSDPRFAYFCGAEDSRPPTGTTSQINGVLKGVDPASPDTQMATMCMRDGVQVMTLEGEGQAVVKITLATAGVPSLSAWVGRSISLNWDVHQLPDFKGGVAMTDDMGLVLAASNFSGPPALPPGFNVADAPTVCCRYVQGNCYSALEHDRVFSGSDSVKVPVGSPAHFHIGDATYLAVNLLNPESASEYAHSAWATWRE